MKATNSYLFEVECKEAGQRRRYGDSFYQYEVVSNRSEREVREFCINVLHKSYEDIMPNPFAGEFLFFQKITDNNKGKSDIFDKREKETYLYKMKEAYTD